MSELNHYRAYHCNTVVATAWMTLIIQKSLVAVCRAPFTLVSTQSTECIGDISGTHGDKGKNRNVNLKGNCSFLFRSSIYNAIQVISSEKEKDTLVIFDANVPFHLNRKNRRT